MAKEERKEEPKEPKAVPVVEAPDNPKTRQWNAFVKGGRFSYEGHENFKGKKAPEYRRAIFVDAAGVEYPAMLCPLPENKQPVIDAPMIDPKGYADELARINALPVEMQAAAMVAFSQQAGQIRKAVVNNGQIVPLANVEGVQLKTVMRQFGEGAASRKVHAPVGDLLVNVANPIKEGKLANEDERWNFVASVVHASAAGTPVPGQPTSPYFKFL